MIRRISRKSGFLAILVTFAIAITGCSQPPVTGHHQPAITHDDVAHLLKEGKRALDAGHLVEPAEDNAADYYRQILAAEPRHPEALAGLDNVLRRLMLHVDEHMARNELTSSAQLLRAAESIKGPTAETRRVRETLTDMQRKATFADRRKNAQVEYFLSTTDLEKKNAEIRQRIRIIARHVKNENKAIVIVGRSSTEIRWIYSQLLAQIPDYRVRANTETGRAPKVILLPYREV